MASQTSQQIDIDLSSAINLSRNRSVPASFTGWTKKDCVIAENVLRKYSLKMSSSGYYRNGEALYRNGSLYKDYSGGRFLHSAQFDDDVIYATFNAAVKMKEDKLLLTYMGNSYIKTLDISRLASFVKVVDTGEKAVYQFDDALWVFDDGAWIDASSFLSTLSSDISRDNLLIKGDYVLFYQYSSATTPRLYAWNYKTKASQQITAWPSTNGNYIRPVLTQIADEIYMTYLGMNTHTANPNQQQIPSSGTIATRWRMTDTLGFTEACVYNYSLPSSFSHGNNKGWAKVVNSPAISTRYYKYAAMNIYYGLLSDKNSASSYTLAESSTSDYILNSYNGDTYYGLFVDTEGYPLFNLVKAGNFELAYISNALMFVSYSGYQLTPYGEVDEDTLSFAGDTFTFRSVSGGWFKYSVSSTGLVINSVDSSIYTNVIGPDNAVIDGSFRTYGAGFVPVMTTRSYSINTSGVRNTAAAWLTDSRGSVNPSSYSTAYQFLVGVNPLPDVTRETVAGPVYNVIMRLPGTCSSSYIQGQLLGFYRFHTQAQKGLRILAYYTNGKDFSGTGAFVFSSIIGTGGTSGYYALLKDTEIGLSEPSSYSIALMSESSSIKSLTAARQYIYKACGSSSLLSVDSDRSMLTGYSANNSMSDIEEMFVISGVIYCIIRDSLYSMSYSDSSMLVPDQYILSTKGMRLLGAGTQEALFLSAVDGKILSFNGSNTLSITGDGTGLGDSIATGFNVPVNMMNVADGPRILFMGDNRMYETHLLQDCVSLSDGVFSTSDSSYEIDYRAKDGMIDIQTMWYQLEDHRLFSADCIYITLYDEDMNDGFIEVSLDTYLSGKTSSQTKRIEVRRTDFDPATCTAYIRYQPKWQNGSMTRFSLKGSYSLAALSMGVTPSVKEISRVSI